MGTRVTVCEMPDETPAFERAWRVLVDHCRGRQTDLVLLPELPFYPWFGTAQTFDGETWRAAEGATEHGSTDSRSLLRRRSWRRPR